MHVDYARRSLEEHKVCLGYRVAAKTWRLSLETSRTAAGFRFVRTLSKPKPHTAGWPGYLVNAVVPLSTPQVERNLKLGEKDVMKPLASMDSDSATPHLARALSSNVSLAAPGAGAGAGAARSPTEHNEGGCAGLGSPGGSCGAAPERSCCSGAGSGSGSGRGRSAGGGRSSGDAAGAGTSSGEGAGAEVEEQEVVEGAV